MRRIVVTAAAATLALSELPRELRSMITSLDARVADDLEPIAQARSGVDGLPLDAVEEPLSKTCTRVGKVRPPEAPGRGDARGALRGV